MGMLTSASPLLMYSNGSIDVSMSVLQCCTVAMGNLCPSLQCYHCSGALVATGIYLLLQCILPVATVLQCSSEGPACSPLGGGLLPSSSAPALLTSFQGIKMRPIMKPRLRGHLAWMRSLEQCPASPDAMHHRRHRPLDHRHPPDPWPSRRSTCAWAKDGRRRDVDSHRYRSQSLSHHLMRK
jgi:hypothetical protein